MVGHQKLPSSCHGHFHKRSRPAAKPDRRVTLSLPPTPGPTSTPPTTLHPDSQRIGSLEPWNQKLVLTGIPRAYKALISTFGSKVPRLHHGRMRNKLPLLRSRP